MHWPWPRFPVTHQTHLVICVAPAQGTAHWATHQERQQPAGPRGTGPAAERPGQMAVRPRSGVKALGTEARAPPIRDPQMLHEASHHSDQRCLPPT